MIQRRVVALAPFLLLGCGGSRAPASPAAGVQWSYEGAEGPPRWSELDPAFAKCGAGKAQSPIDLPRRPTQSAEKAPATPKWDPVPVRVTNDGHFLKVDDTAPSSFTFEGTTYALKSFHFHVPAEHTIEGRNFDAEAHFIHKSPDGKKTVVVALLFQHGRENELLRPMWDAFPSTIGAEPVDTGRTIDVQALLPKAPKYVRYDGSLTAPPCTEGITWLVVEPETDTPLQLSMGQIGRHRAATHGPTNRPTQPLDGRVILELNP
jgi:carbonic anhydrase